MAGNPKTPTDALASTVASDGPAEYAPILAGMRLGDRYRVLEALGRGAMGAVWLATDEVLGDKFAIKFVARDPRGLHALRDEVRLAQRVTHRNVCRTFDLVEASGFAFVKMEYVAGESLAERIRRVERCPVDEALRIARQIAAALEAAHACAIVHRDLKPANVMIDARGRVVVMDFGIARNQDARGEISGTPAYMAPEQANGFAVDGRADLYALGCVLFELLAGAPPFVGANADETLSMQVDKPPPELRPLRPDVPGWLADVVARLLAKDPAGRFADAVALSTALDGPRRRWPLAVALALLPLAGLTVFLATRGHAPEWRPIVRDHLPVFDENTNSAAFSPDGKWLVYNSDREDNEHARLYLAPADGGPGRPLTAANDYFDDARWAPDGRSVFTTQLSQLTVYRISINEQKSELVAKNAGAPEVCGERLVYMRFGSSDCQGCAEIIARSGDSERELYRLPQSQMLDFLRCDRSGRWLSFLVRPRDFSLTKGADLWAVRMRSDGTHDAPRAVAPGTKAFSLTMTDEETIVFSASQGNHTNLWEIPVRGGKPIQRTFGDGPDHRPDVSPDGKQLIYAIDRTFGPLLAHSLESGRTHRVTAAVEEIVHPIATSDGRFVVADANRDDGRTVIVAIDLKEAAERVLAEGRTPAISESGEVFFVAADEELRRLRAVPLAGGVARDVATLPGAINAIAVGGDGVHLMVLRTGRAEAWRVPLHGGPAEREANEACLVIPAPHGGARVELDCRQGFLAKIRFAGAPIDGLFGAWDADGRSFVYSVPAGVHRRFVDGRDEALFPLPTPRLVSVSPDGRTIYYSNAVSHVRRQIITNWNSRPRPWRR